VNDGALLIHVHIPRTAGTSIANWLSLATQAGKTSGHASVYTGEIFGVRTGLLDTGLGDPRIQTISTHDARTFPDRFIDRRAYYFTILREPLSQFASYMRYISENRESFRVPRRLRDRREVVEWYLDARFGELVPENPQTNHLALHTWCAMSDNRFDPERYALWSNHDTLLYWSARLEVAKSVLRTFLMVGIFEHLNESLGLLRERAARVGIDPLPQSHLPRLNETKAGGEDESWMDPGDPLYERIVASLETDIALYEYACALFGRPHRSVAADRSRTT
jgi:hypothetical protein